MSRELLTDVCLSVLKARFKCDSHRDSCLDSIAVAGLVLDQPYLFKKAVGRMAVAFDEVTNSTLGRLVDLQALHIPEESLIDSLTKSGKVDVVHKAMRSFRRGFLEANANRNDSQCEKYVEFWLDDITGKALEQIQITSRADPRSVVEMILDRHGKGFRQLMMYQAIRKCVERLAPGCCESIALVVELLANLQDAGSSQRYLQTLLDRILSSTTLHFNLRWFADYIGWRAPQAAASYQTSVHWTEISRGKPSAGPIAGLYNALKPQDRLILLQRMREQAASLSAEQGRQFLLPMLNSLVEVVDPASSMVRECLQSLFAAYVVETVGQEPPEPSSWARPDEMARTPSPEVACISRMNAFLADATATTLSIKQDDVPRLQWGFKFFRYFDEEREDHTVVAVTKTKRQWREQHEAWRKRCTEARNALSGLPQAKLQECLATQYDEIVNLGIVRCAGLGEGDPEAGDSGQCERPRKRARVED
ncbi:hypothetical protein LTR73_008686 [Friedmanniomyces endolithicus]|nr:hypothetical protein LTR73_008686 [Friedmanniomyces endolithicus]